MTAIHLRLERHMSVLLLLLPPPPPRHCINNVSSDTAEPGGEGDGDNLLRDLKGTPAAGDKGVCAREWTRRIVYLCSAGQWRPGPPPHGFDCPDCSRTGAENQQAAASLRHVTCGPQKPASPPGKHRDANVAPQK